MPTYVFGSYFRDALSTGSLQTIVMSEKTPFTAIVEISDTSVNGGVTLANSALTVPYDASYAIDWNATVDGISSSTPVGALITFHLNLLVNGATVRPFPQAVGSTPYSTNSHHSYITLGDSMITPLSAGDEISLSLTVDGDLARAGDPYIGSGVRVDSVQISATQISQ